MINRNQHFMIFALYALFSVFIGIIFITLSDTFYVGAGSFFSFLLSFVAYHLFWLGKKITGRMSAVSKIVSNLDNNKNTYDQDIKSVRDIIDNMTEIINTLINSSNSTEENIEQQQAKNDVYLNKINEQIEFLQTNFQTKINALEQQNNRLISWVDKLSTTPAQSYNSVSSSELDDSFIHEDFMNLSNNIQVGKINENKSLYDAHSNPEQRPYTPNMPVHKRQESVDMVNSQNFSDDFYTLKNNNHAQTNNLTFDFDEDGFLSFDNDDSFSNLNLPHNTALNTQNFPVNAVHNTTDVTPAPNENDDAYDDEFSTIDPHISESYGHLLQSDHDETFYEALDDYQTKIIREQINAQRTTHSNAQNPNTNNLGTQHTPQETAISEEDFFVDITQDIKSHAQNPASLQDNNSDDNPLDNTVDDMPQMLSATTATPVVALNQSLPSLVELAPDIQLKSLVKRQKIIQTNVPSLDAILSKPLKKKSSQLQTDSNNTLKIPEETEEFIDNTTHSEADKDSSTPQNTSTTNTNIITDDSKKSIANTKHNPLIEIIRTALDTNNLTLFTAPVSDCRVNDVRFFDNYLYLPQANGQFIPHSEFVPLARKMSWGIALDRFMISETIKLSNYLKTRIPEVGIFCNISLLSVTDAHFEGELYKLLSDKKEINQHLIFSFPQEELQLLTSIHIEKMLHFLDMGIRFCVDNIYNILPDLSELHRIGIRFMKLRISDFSKGIYANHKVYKGQDIKQICQQSNILLCIKDINDHADLLTAVENQSDLLQGDLLGEKERSEFLEDYAT